MNSARMQRRRIPPGVDPDKSHELSGNKPVLYLDGSLPKNSQGCYNTEVHITVLLERLSFG